MNQPGKGATGPLTRQQRRDAKPIREGLTAGQLRAAEAELADGVVERESSHATTLAVLAHSWFALDHQREASRVMYERTVELRRSGREAQTDAIVQQYAEAKAEITLVESQIVRLLAMMAEEDGEVVALALLGSTHMNMLNGIGVRFPVGVRDRLAVEAGIKADPEASETEPAPRDDGHTA